jgi:hypothetical protein
MHVGFAPLFAELEVAINLDDPVRPMVFPEMDAAAEMPEITRRAGASSADHSKA